MIQTKRNECVKIAKLQVRNLHEKNLFRICILHIKKTHTCNPHRAGTETITHYMAEAMVMVHGSEVWFTGVYRAYPLNYILVISRVGLVCEGLNVSVTARIIPMFGLVC